MIKTYKINEKQNIIIIDQLSYIKSNYEVIRNECLNLDLKYYKEYKNFNEFSTKKNSWKVYTLYYKGYKFFYNKHCEKTLSILKKTNVVNAGFSLFYPGTITTVHKGNTPYTFRSHLGIDVPSSCEFKIENKYLSVKNGEMNFFPADLEHQAWNKSNENRIILILDFLRPEYKNKILYKNIFEKIVLKIGDIL